MSFLIGDNWLAAITDQIIGMATSAWSAIRRINPFAPRPAQPPAPIHPYNDLPKISLAKATAQLYSEWRYMPYPLLNPREGRPPRRIHVWNDLNAIPHLLHQLRRTPC